MSTQDFILLWASKCTYPVKHVVPENSHDYYQIVYILSGEGEISIKDLTYNVNVNELYIIEPNIKHSIMASKVKSLNTVEIKFNCYNSNHVKILNQLAPLVENIEHSVRNAFFNIIEEVKNPDIYSESIITIILNEIIAYLTRSLHRKRIQSLKNITKVNSISNNESIDALDKVVQYITKEYHRDIKLNDLAEMIYLSPVYFCSIFKEKFGISPIQYLQNVRLENAKRMLRDTDFSITQIAERVGFKSVHYFSRFFKTHEEITPNEYRRRIQGFICKDFNGHHTQF